MLHKSFPVSTSLRVALALMLVSSCLFAQSRSSVNRRSPVRSSTTSRQNVSKPSPNDPALSRAISSLGTLAQSIVTSMANDDYETAAKYRTEYNNILASSEGQEYMNLAAMTETLHAIEPFRVPPEVYLLYSHTPKEIDRRLRDIGKSLKMLDDYIYEKKLAALRKPPPYINNENAFSIRFPPGWTIKHAEFSEDIIIKAIYRRADQAFAALNIHRYVFDTSIDVASFSPVQLFNMAYAKQGELLDSGVEIIGNHRAPWLLMRIQQDSTTIYAIGYLIFREKDAFWLYGNTVLGGNEWFASNLPLFLESIRSFVSTSQ